MSSSDEDLVKLWVWFKELGTWAAQHPALMGIFLLMLGYFVKQTRVVVTSYVSTGRQGPADPRYPPGTDPYLFDKVVTVHEGLDLDLLKHVFTVIPGVPSSGNITVQALSTFGVWLGDTFPTMKPYLDSLKSGAQQGLQVTVAFTLGDLLLIGGGASLVGDAISKLIPKI